jgi:hypothetical protein
MTKRKHNKKLSHPIEVMREVYLLQSAQHRLRGIVVGLGLAENADRWNASALITVLRNSIVAEANSVADIADRLAGLAGRNIAKLQPKAVA